ncbi:hypothetical protein [Acuticoccus sp.]|uniref:hypothetical protein n=1 Tax=Acuticoccus sp. TaxID=1904378 RepID=UPI003B51F9C8
MTRLLAVVLAVSVAGALTSCGRRGSPQLPASAADEPRVAVYPAEPGGDTVPDRSFVLDPILQ